MTDISPDLLAQAVAWRRSFHARPEIGLREHETADRIAALLASFGLEVARGLAGTGVVGILRNGDGPALGLRADMDALPIQEKNTFSHRSQTANCMHACGHDGHMAILLATARHLSATRRFSGTVYFVFQPAEENAGGGQMMVQQGLFSRFPMQAIYALHNWPGMPAGHVAVGPGPMMASHDSFRITLSGTGCHAAMPEQGSDPIVAAAQLILALQTVVSRRLAPQEAAAISITQIHAGESMNVIPDSATLAGTVRCLRPATREKVLPQIADFVAGLPALFGVRGELKWEYGYPVTENHPDAAAALRDAAAEALGAARVRWDPPPSMAAEDFSYMLQACPGAYCWLGADGDAPSAALHNPGYDFNDEIIADGIRLWVSLVEKSLRPDASLHPHSREIP